MDGATLTRDWGPTETDRGTGRSLRIDIEARVPAERPSFEPEEAAVEPTPGPGGRGSETGHAVLRAALDEERDRTTRLRRDLDDARVFLARAEAEAQALARHRDIWADRSAQLRTALRETRAALTEAEAERGALRARAAAQGAEIDRLRVHRDIWAERARALAAAFCREPAEAERESGDEPCRPARDRQILRSVAK